MLLNLSVQSSEGSAAVLVNQTSCSGLAPGDHIINRSPFLTVELWHVFLQVD